MAGSLIGITSSWRNLLHLLQIYQVQVQVIHHFTIFLEQQDNLLHLQAAQRYQNPVFNQEDQQELVFLQIDLTMTSFSDFKTSIYTQLPWREKSVKKEIVTYQILYY